MTNIRTQLGRLITWIQSANWLFLLVVLLPTLLASIYFGAVASSSYHSESRFLVKSAQRSTSSNPLSALVSGALFARSQDESYVVHDYLQSRDILRVLESEIPLRERFSDPRIDALQRFPQFWTDASFESFHRFFLNRIEVTFDPTSGITTLRVSAPSAELAQQTNQKLLKLSEQLINNLNTRGRQDLLAQAKAEVEAAERRLKDASAAVASYRSRQTVFDPERQAGLQLQQLNRLQDELLAARTQLSQLRGLAPDNPQIPSQRRRVEILETEVKAETKRVLGGSDRSLASKSAQFERLNLERTLAEKQLAAALVSLDGASQEALRQHLYLEVIARPNLPDREAEPRRLRAVLIVFAFSLMLYVVLALLLAGIREHKDR